MATALSLGPPPPTTTQKKVFVGGLSWETDEQSLRDYFGQYGPVSDCVIMRDRLTGHPRGFGFVTYDDQLVAERVAAEFHELDGRQVEAKIAVPRSECVPAVRTNAWRATKKVFVGGLPATCRENELHAHFIRFGDIAECQVMYDHQTGNSRGFGFVTFTSEATVDRVVDIEEHEIMAKHVEVKRAEPKQALEARRGREAAAAMSNSLPSGASQQSSLLISPQKHQQPHLSSAPSMPYAPLGNANSAPIARSPPSQSPFQDFGPWSSLFSPGAGTSWNALLSSATFAANGANDAAANLGLNAQGAAVTSGATAHTPASMPAAIAPSHAGQSSAARAPLGGMGFFTPAQPYSPDVAQCVYNAFYGASTPHDAFINNVPNIIPSARVERRFHPYSTRERIERSYR